jgi:predicted nucleic acid-binding protein
MALLTEAFHLLGRIGGWPAQARLLEFVDDGLLEIEPLAKEDLLSIRSLVDAYQDTPMDFADASLVLTAERQGLRTIFSLDKDFWIYRIHGKEQFAVIPTR